MDKKISKINLKLSLIASALTLSACISGVAIADDANSEGRLLATGGVTEVEGSEGGGISPWALISGYETQDQIGATAFLSNVSVPNYQLQAGGAAVGFYNRVEISAAQQQLSLGTGVLGALNAGPTSIRQDVFGVKVRVLGDAIFDQDTWVPQVSVGMQYKHNLDFSYVPKTIGAQNDSGTDFYIAATKLILGGFAGHNLLLNGTVRETKANQMGLLGFGGPTNNSYSTEFEGSFGVFLDAANQWAVGGEYRQNPDNGLTAGGTTHFKQSAYSDAYVAYFPNKRFALTVAYVDLGDLPNTTNSSGTLNQSSSSGMYISGQFSF